jgi:hypothetical protein
MDLIAAEVFSAAILRFENPQPFGKNGVSGGTMSQGNHGVVEIGSSDHRVIGPSDRETPAPGLNR